MMEEGRLQHAHGFWNVYGRGSHGRCVVGPQRPLGDIGQLLGVCGDLRAARHACREWCLPAFPTCPPCGYFGIMHLVVQGRVTRMLKCDVVWVR